MTTHEATNDDDAIDTNIKRSQKQLLIHFYIPGADARV